MTRYILILFLISSTIVHGQNNFDTLQIEKELKSIVALDKSSNLDIKIIKAIKAFDDNFYKIVGDYKYPPYKNTIIRSGTIQVRQLTDKGRLLQIILSDSFHFRKDIAIWQTGIHDTTIFLANLLAQHNQLEFSDFYWSNSILLKKFDTLIIKLDPLIISRNINLKNVIFYSNQLNLTADSIARKISKKQKQNLYKYLKDNFDYFDTKVKKFDTKAICITSIIFSDSNLVYMAADIYGQHFLLTFNSYDNWSFVNKKPLWIY